MICMRTRCKSEGDFTLKAWVPAQNQLASDCSPVEVYCGLRMCHACAGKIKVNEFFTEELKDSVSMMMHTQNQAIPDFFHTQLIIISCDDPQLLMLEAKHATIH